MRTYDRWGYRSVTDRTIMGLEGKFDGGTVGRLNSSRGLRRDLGLCDVVVERHSFRGRRDTEFDM